jgi:NAD(P)-dependent dehydrogenase (short-subunit alcohol dehydrogenase family)
MAKVAVVTGAGTGVGRAVALGLLEKGYNVALAGRRIPELEQTASLAKPGAALVVPTDCSDEQAVDALFERTVAEFGRVDLLFNNAGRGAPPVPIDELPVETWRAVVDINLTGAFLCARAAFRQMRNQSPRGGRIINNGSISAHAPRPFTVAYTSTKHAITGLTKQLALDGRGYDIVCGQIDIGNADTPMTARMKEGVLQADLSTATEPVMNAKHVADAVVYMDGLPLDSNVLFMTVMANLMPFVGRG